jgi:acyl carrier protein
MTTNTQVLRILSKIQPDFDFSQDLNFIEEGMIDSFDMINLVTELDEEFGISIDGVDIIPENFSTISAIVLLLNKSGIHK